MKKKEAVKRTCLRPTPSVIVSMRDENGKNNALTIGYCCNCSFDPPMLAIAINPARYSYHIINQTRCFVVNLTTKENESLIEYMGTVSGRDVDKFKEMKVETEEAINIDAPLIKECPVNIECLVVDSIHTGSHVLFIAKVLYVHAREELIKEDGTVDKNKIKFI